ncbi:MAG: hypothetical protein NTW16_12145 [Bacteroidetes bacterium]|nr:hypothetical protein [Bacteroidota bacterium]
MAFLMLNTIIPYKRKSEVQSSKDKRKWEGQSSKDEQRPANPSLCTSSFVILSSSFIRTSCFALCLTKCQKSGEFPPPRISLLIRVSVSTISNEMGNDFLKSSFDAGTYEAQEKINIRIEIF